MKVDVVLSGLRTVGCRIQVAEATGFTMSPLRGYGNGKDYFEGKELCGLCERKNAVFSLAKNFHCSLCSGEHVGLNESLGSPDTGSWSFLLQCVPKLELGNEGPEGLS